MQALKYDIAVLGSGLAGMRASLQAAHYSNGKMRIALISKMHAMRSHSVSAEGGISGVLYPGENGDSIDLHGFDTAKGGDYLGDQQAIETLVNEAPGEIRFFDHLGVPWNRTEDGRIMLRAFGGMSVPRTAFAADKTGFFMLNALYDNILSFPNIDIYHEHYATHLVVKGNRFRAFVAIDLSTGERRAFVAKAGIIATGGASRVFGFTTTAYSSTGDGIALAYKAGVPVKDMEFTQFHPTGLIPSGVLITEAARGEGGYLLNNQGRRFMEDYAKSKMELAPRDIVSRAIMTEINQGRGFVDETSGFKYVQLDLRHLGEAKIDERLPMIKELVEKTLGFSPVKEPIPVRPAAHHTMGGINVNLRGQVMLDEGNAIEGLWAAGECGCVSVHGANRLGSNSLSQCVIWGKMEGEAAAELAMKNELMPVDDIAGMLDSAEGEIDGLLANQGTENPYQLRKELWDTMDANVYVFRTVAGLETARKKLRELRDRYREIYVSDKGSVYNANLREAIEIGNMIELAQAIVEGAINRKESRGAHAMVEFPARDDGNFLKHTLAYRTEGFPRVSYLPVNITRWQPMERKY
ncbi:MAG: succinate dehydrogenase/fumarate reductase flavoprotein subunit [Nitrososphaerota archaeon]|jgi:succinate dehydrogenase / fumarate reductase flavoprotein subunit|nr:succinate dehydrogenase/fumarate reductase flavoprotein subunit [Nitrososphaerota archaeon]MDG6936800.1 succinate dehydrogenase/fumarate reductase flavoprotein subunit [Nitrososphaerota archaeon]MDG6943656.1 succinate dehydrogenase/fumarate reductase flavoprotein subunit [Nitrososphaerota archaeon]